MEELELYLTREEAFGLKVGGVERVRCWLTRPRSEVTPAEGIFSESSRWVADTWGFSARAFRKAGADDLVKAVWDHMERTAFPGIPYEEWDRRAPGFRDHPDSVQADAWIGSVRVRFSPEPGESLFPMPLTLTGPFGDRTQYKEPDRDARPIAWLGPTMLQPKERFLPEPFDSAEPKDFWTQPGRQGSVLANDFAVAGLTEIGERIDAALAAGDPGTRTWSCEVPVWVGLASGRSDA